MYMQDINNDLQWKQFPCYNLQNGLICTCHQGGEGEGEVVPDIGGANAEQSLQILDLQRLTSLKRQCGGSATLARTRQKISHAIQREFLPFPLKFFPWPSGKHYHHHHHHHHHHWFEWLFWNWNQIWIKCLLETVWNHSSSSIKAAILVY